MEIYYWKKWIYWSSVCQALHRKQINVRRCSWNPIGFMDDRKRENVQLPYQNVCQVLSWKVHWSHWNNHWDGNRILKTGLGYSSVNSIRSVLSSIIKPVCKITFDMQTFKEHFNIRPAFSRHVTTWSVTKVSTFIKSKQTHIVTWKFFS